MSYSSATEVSRCKITWRRELVERIWKRLHRQSEERGATRQGASLHRAGGASGVFWLQVAWRSGTLNAKCNWTPVSGQWTGLDNREIRCGSTSNLGELSQDAMGWDASCPALIRPYYDAGVHHRTLHFSNQLQEALIGQQCR